MHHGTHYKSFQVVVCSYFVILSATGMREQEQEQESKHHGSYYKYEILLRYYRDGIVYEALKKAFLRSS